MTREDSLFQEFLDRLDLYGGRLEDWPVEARAAAEALLEHSSQARAQWNAMRRAEAALMQSQSIRDEGISDIAARAMQSAQAHPHPAAIRRLPWAVAAMAALIAGVYIGQLPASAEEPTEIVTAALDQSGGSHDVW
jgi:hypothetical protein